MTSSFEIALGEYGIKERRGGENPEILKYFREIGHPDIIEDEVSWCSAFVNWCILKSGLQPTGSLAAKSWLTWGEKITEPQIGDIVIFNRGEIGSWQGHVGFFVRLDKDGIWVLGGNQADQVNISWYPISKLAGYRRII
jgi:uncharacterized protein (TIGR02594 family)